MGALDKHPADLSHLLDPQSSGLQTPLPFVSRRGLQQAVEGLTENFRVWIDAIYQSIMAALQNKADSAQVDFIAHRCKTQRAVQATVSLALPSGPWVVAALPVTQYYLTILCYGSGALRVQPQAHHVLVTCPRPLLVQVMRSALQADQWQCRELRLPCQLADPAGYLDWRTCASVMA